MHKKIIKILSSMLLVSTMCFSFVSCGGSNNSNTTQDNSTSRPSRKPQVTTGENTENQVPSLYKDGEIVSLADGTKLKYSTNGDHEIIEKGDGKVLIFKHIKQEDLDSLDENQRSLIERQMKSDPNGFALIY